MIVDVFLFQDEFDMLRARMYELASVVDRVIVIEADHTFSGEPKPYCLTEFQKDHYDFWKYPIEIIRVETGNAAAEGFHQEGNWVQPGSEEAWARETKQRNAADDMVRALPPDTIVLFGDLDEIPRREVVESFDGPPSCLMLVPFVYSTRRCLHGLWHGPFISRVGEIKPTSATNIRISRNLFPRVLDAGWHCSWFGTSQDRERKLRSFSHRELTARISGSVGDELAHRHLHVDETSELIEYGGDPPAWVRDGHAPTLWTQEY